ncbi:MAG TPA: hypothetical protein VGN05_02735 [Parvibaculum sp.]
MPVDLTSTWIPLSLLAVLCTYMFVLFQRERRASLAFESMEPAAPAVTHVSGHDIGHAESHEAPVAAPAPAEARVAPTSSAHVVPAQAVAPEKAKTSLMWRTAHIWLPFVAGFAGQGYLDVIKPMIVKAAG